MRCLDIVQTDEECLFIMEYCPDGTLNDLIKKRGTHNHTIQAKFRKARRWLFYGESFRDIRSVFKQVWSIATSNQLTYLWFITYPKSRTSASARLTVVVSRRCTIMSVHLPICRQRHTWTIYTVRSLMFGQLA